MLTIFNSFRAPGVPYVEICRDSDDPTSFWLLNGQPRVPVDVATGERLLTYSLIARDVDIVYASTPPDSPMQHQLGYLTMTVDLSIPEEDLNKIREYLRGVLEAELGRPSFHNRLFRLQTRAAEPKIDYANTWLSGTVRLDLLNGLGDTFRRSGSEEIKPNLRGTCSAALWATFGSEGAQLLWDALHPPPNPATLPGGALPLQANITYNLEGIARVPELKVRVEADGSQVYREIRNRIQVFERVDGKTWSYPQVSELTKSLVENRVIRITWEDFGIPPGDLQADDMKAKLQSTMLDVVANQITSNFFQKFDFQGLQDADLGQTFTHSLGGKPGSRLWLNEFKEEFVSNIDFSLDYRTNMRFTANPQTALLATLTPEEIDRHVRVLDVGNPSIQVMNIHTETNADFAGDRIANIELDLEYDAFDEMTQKQIRKVGNFIFRKPDDRFIFPVRMARDAQGRLIDTYNARAQINYIGVGQSPPPIELKGINDRTLTFSYDRLGTVKVEVAAGDVDWDQIASVFVDFRYTPAPGEPDTSGTVQLTNEKRIGSWSCSKHGKTSNDYSYTVRYVFKNGQEVPARAESDDRGQLVVHDKLIGRLRRTFDVVLSAGSVKALNLIVRYQDQAGETEEISHVFAATGSWEYVRRLTEGATRDLQYRYVIEYADGHVEATDNWLPLPENASSEPIIARRFPLDLLIDGGGLDWTRWRMAVAEITYEDKDHRFTTVQETIVRQTEDFKKLPILAFSPTARKFTYRVTLVPKDPAAGEPVVKEGDHTGILLLETLV